MPLPPPLLTRKTVRSWDLNSGVLAVPTHAAPPHPIPAISFQNTDSPGFPVWLSNLGCVIPDKRLHPSVPQFPPLENGPVT